MAWRILMVAGTAVALAGCGEAAVLGNAAPSRAEKKVPGTNFSRAAAATAGPSEPELEPTFRLEARRLSAERRATMTGVSWHKGCPVSLDDLRIVRLRHWTFADTPRTGRLIVNADAVRKLRKVFRALFDAEFPIRRMRPVDVYGGDDFDSIEADNTSAFNCRAATGSTRFSEHAYGRAIDVNPIENPYVYANGTSSHPDSGPYLDRGKFRKGMAVEGGALVEAFDAVGWGWGGRWAPPTDYQHFSAAGR